MTQTKFTPAPWLANHGRELGYWPYVQRGIAGGNTIQSSCGQDNALADAHLIAAAPELYEALKNLIVDGMEWGALTSEQMEQRYEASRRALRKARGE